MLSFPDPSSESQMWLFRFLQQGACVKKFIDNCILCQSSDNSCLFCKKQYVLRNTYVHETDCLVRLALESKQDDRKLRQFVLNAQDFFFDQDMRKGEALPIAEVLQVTRFGRILYDDWENTYHEHLWREMQRTNYFEIDETPYTEYPDTTEGFINPFILEQSWKKMKNVSVCSVDLVSEKKNLMFINMWLIMEYFTRICFLRFICFQ